MATQNENVNIKISVQADDSMKSLRQMKQEMRDLTIAMEEAAAKGDKTKFNELSASLGQLKNDMKDAKIAMNAMDPGELLNGYTKLAQGAIGAFAGISGAMSLFTDDQEALNEIQKKSAVLIQTMMGLEQARAILIDQGGRAQIKALVATTIEQKKKIAAYVTEALTIKTVEGATGMATKAQLAWNLAVKAMMGPIGWITAGVAALALGVYALSGTFDDNTEAIEASNKALDDFQKRTTIQNQAIEDQAAKMQAQGKSELEILNYKKVRYAELAKEMQDQMDVHSAYMKRLNSNNEELVNSEIKYATQLQITKAGYESMSRAVGTQMSNLITKNKELKKTVVEVSDAEKKAAEEAQKLRDAAWDQLDATLDKQEDWEQEKKKRTEERQMEEATSEQELLGIKLKQLERYYTEANTKRDATLKKNSEALEAAGQTDAELQIAYRAEVRIADEKYAADKEDLMRESAAKQQALREEETKKIEEEAEKRLDIEDEYSKKVYDQRVQFQYDLIDATSSILDLAAEEEIKKAGENEEEIKKIKKKYALIDAGLALSKIAIQTAVAISEATAMAGPTLGASLALIPGIIASGALQAATVVAQQLYIQSMGKGGMVEGPSHSSSEGGVLKNLEGGEGVLTKKAMANPRLRTMASAINVAGGGIPFTNVSSVSNNDSNALLSASIDSNTVELIVNKIASIPVVVVESDITTTQRKVRAIESRTIIG